MDALDPATPVLIGVGQAAERPDQAHYRALSPMDLAGEAARAALADAGARAAVAPHIDVVAAVRQFEISTPMAVPPFGGADNPPRAIARRIGADPHRAVLEITGGQGPQRLIAEFCAEIAAGRAEAVLLAGAEAQSTVLTLKARGEAADWSETAPGSMEDRGYGLEGLLSADMLRHRVRSPLPCHALFETARRGRLGQSREVYAQAMGALFAPFTKVAAANPLAAAPRARSAEALITPGPDNRMVADPYTRLLVARDQVNQGAAVLIASVGLAQRLGVAPERWVFLHGHGDGDELSPMRRPDMGAAPASIAAARLALERAGRTTHDMAVFDFYSCFPIAVSNMLDGLGLDADDPRGLTLTGGLPYFGGAGNNYAMHAAAEMVQALRRRPGAFGLLGANGGMLSKYAAGVYSTVPADWRDPGARCAQAPKAEDAVRVLDVAPDGGAEAAIEAYTLVPHKGGDLAIAVLRLADGAGRLIANAEDAPTLAALRDADPLGRWVRTATGEDGLNRFVFA